MFVVDKCKICLGYNVVPPPYTGNFMPLKLDLSFSGLEEFMNEHIVSEPIIKQPVVKTSKAKASADKPKVVRKNYGAPIIEDWVSDILMKSGQVSLNTARQVNTAHPKITVNSARPMTNLSKTAHSTIKRPIHKNTTFKNSNFNQRINTVKDKNINATRPKAIVNAARPKAVVNVARPKAVVNVVKGNNVNAVKASACWVWKPKTKFLDHVSKHNSASTILKRFDYIDAQGDQSGERTVIGASKIIMTHDRETCPILRILKGRNMVDMLPLEVNPKEGKSQARGKARMEIVHGKDYILLPLWTVDLPFSQDPKSFDDDVSKSSSDDGKKVDEVPRKESECNDQEKEYNVNSTNNVNAADTHEVNAAGGKTSIELPDDPDMPELEDYSIFEDAEDDGAEADMNNLDAFMPVSPIPTTRVRKDHLVEQIIRDLNLAPQTRRITKNLEEHGFFSSVQQRTNHKNFQNYLFACFLSQEEPKKDPSWIKAMQEELLQFKLQEVWTLVDLLNGKRAIGSKWGFRNKKDEKGILIRNKARLVALGYTQEEWINYYASFKDFVVYQMDVKSDFLYGKIEEDVYLLELVYVDDIIFGSTKKELCIAFEKLMHEKFQMSSMGELTFFLGLQVKQKKDGIFIRGTDISQKDENQQKQPEPTRDGKVCEDGSPIKVKSQLQRRKSKEKYNHDGQNNAKPLSYIMKRGDSNPIWETSFIKKERGKRRMEKKKDGGGGLFLRTQKGNSCIEGSKLDRGYAGRASIIQVTRRYTKEEGIDYDEVFAPVARIEEIRLFLAYASFKDFMVYEMDVKSVFLYGKIKEEVYVCQPLGVKDLDFPDRVYKVEKALYGLHQAPRAWYETLSTYLLDNGFQRGKIYKTLFIKRYKGDILLMSSIGELTFFFGLQVKQKDGIFISQDKYVEEILKKFKFTEVKTASTPMETQKPLLKDEDGEEVDVHMYRLIIGSLMYLTSSRPDIMFVVCACARYQVNSKVSHLYAVKRIFRYLKGQPKLGLWYPKESPFDLVAYTDSDCAGVSLDRKFIIGGCQFVECRLISWQCKKQTVVANSITDAEYVAASSCCRQVIWFQNQLLDYGYNFMHTKIFIDNNSTICIIKNLVFH
ncbi:putative ribonuclease H-like domain-containing protein [Tanacetum coccineum]